MRVFAFEHPGGIVGGFTVVVADNIEHAHDLLFESLRKQGISPRADDVKEIDLTKPGAYMLFDGVY